MKLYAVGRESKHKGIMWLSRPSETWQKTIDEDCFSGGNIAHLNAVESAETYAKVFVAEFEVPEPKILKRYS